MKRLKDLLDLAFSYLIILPTFWLVIYYSRLHEKVKEFYYIVFRIPYYKIPDKFYCYVRRKNK